MTTITLPRRDLPIAGGLQVSGDWYRWARDITERAGGVTGASTTELSASQFEDAGIAEGHAQMFANHDELRQLPPSLPPIAGDDPVNDVASLRAELAVLRAEVEALKQGLYS